MQHVVDKIHERSINKWAMKKGDKRQQIAYNKRQKCKGSDSEGKGARV